MSEAVEKKESAGVPAWVMTFADLMTLLMCFFVLLLSFSEMDRRKYKMVSGSMAQAFGIQRERPVFESPRGEKMIAKEFDQAVMITKIEEAIKPIIDEIKDEYEELKDAVELEVEEDKVTIRMMGETTFDTGKAELHPAFRPLLKKNRSGSEPNQSGDHHSRSYRQRSFKWRAVWLQPGIVHGPGRGRSGIFAPIEYH